MRFLTQIAATALLVVLPLITTVAQQISGSIKGFDSIAGFTTLIKGEGFTPYDSLIINVQKPGGELLILPVQADKNGAIVTDLYDFHTKKAGIYSIRAQQTHTQYQTSESTFIVYPDEVSAETSSITTSTLTARANNSDSVLLTVQLLDEYRNPIQNHIINLFSSRNADKIVRVSPDAYTNAQGEMSFVVSSLEPGVSTYGALDLTSNITLNDRAQVAFLKNHTTSNQAVGGDLINNSLLRTSVLQAQAAGPVNKFAIEDIATQVDVNQSLSFTVVAQDSNSQKVSNYTGGVRFTVTDPHAVLPPDYTFKETDAGEHTFSLGLRFVTPGTHKLGVVDTENTDLRGEFTIIVGSTTPQTTSSQTSTQTNTSSQNSNSTTTQTPVRTSTGSSFQRTQPIISSPSAGTYNKKDLIVSGTAGIGDQLILFDNDVNSASSSADNQGRFTFQLKNLKNGVHTLRVGVTDGSGTIFSYSDNVKITLDNNAPGVDEVKIFPDDTVAVGSNALIKVYSEQKLSEAAIIINNKIYELIPVLSELGAYSVSVSAPSATGQYPIDLVLIDELGNEGNYAKAATLTVVATDAAGNTSGGSNNVPASVQVTPEAVVPGAPTKVTEVTGYNSDSRVTLNWKAATDNTFIQKYKVYYGIEADNLIVAVSTFDATTRWYIPNLTNGQKYYFAVAAIDSEGNIGPRSDVVEGTPVAGVAHPSPGQPSTNGPTSNTPAEVTPNPSVVAGSIAGEQETSGQSENISAPGSSGQASTVTVDQPQLTLPDRTPETGPESIIITLLGIVFALSLSWVQHKFSTVKQRSSHTKNTSSAEYYQIRF